MSGDVLREDVAKLVEWLDAQGRQTFTARHIRWLLANALAAAESPVVDEGEVWCETCQHIHIAAIPTITYLCHQCGFGQWTHDMAEEHEAQTGHITYRCGHVMTALATGGDS